MFCRVCRQPVEYINNFYTRVTFEQGYHVYYHNPCFTALTGVQLKKPERIRLEEIKVAS